MHGRLLSVFCALAFLMDWPAAQAPEIQFELVQPELFSATGAQPNAWADFDNDGDLDLFVANQEGDANGFFSTTAARSATLRRVWAWTPEPALPMKEASAQPSRISIAMATSISSWPTTARTRSIATSAAGLPTLRRRQESPGGPTSRRRPGGT